MYQETNERVVASGKLFELVQAIQPDGQIFEIARRAPGVRLIIGDKDNEKILLSREFRHELDGWDYRLPGGKVFNSLLEFESFRTSNEDIIAAATQKAIAEGREEVGLEIQDIALFKKSTLGATVEWDLYIFEVTKWQQASEGQQLEVGELIEADNWFTFTEVENMIIRGAMQEERIALILLQWIKQYEKRKQS